MWEFSQSDKSKGDSIEKNIGSGVFCRKYIRFRGEIPANDCHPIESARSGRNYMKSTPDLHSK